VKSTGSILVVILGLLLLACVPVLAAGVHNVTLSAASGCAGGVAITGTATTIVGDVSGSNPYHNVEINIKVDKAPAAGMVYQAWLIDSKDNVKTSLGAFNGTTFGDRQKMVNFTDSGPYDSIAVSLEPANNQNPNPSTIVAQGSLPGSAVSASDFETTAVLPADESFQQTAISQRFKLTSDQFASLRMQGFGYSDIALIGNSALQCNKSTSDIASQITQGQTWDQIASTCNLTTAMLLEPSPQQAVAGSIQETVCPQMPMPMIRPYHFYLKYGNGAPVMTARMWRELRMRGYSWQDVCIASNISSYTSESIDDLLRMIRIQGLLWSQIANARGLNPDKMQDVSRWPFSKDDERMPEGERQVLPKNQPMPMEMTPPEPMPAPAY
jgi:hypothetical protein